MSLSPSEDQGFRDEAHGGDRISDHGLVDLTLVA